MERLPPAVPVKGRICTTQQGAPCSQPPTVLGDRASHSPRAAPSSTPSRAGGLVLILNCTVPGRFLFGKTPGQSPNSAAALELNRPGSGNFMSASSSHSC